MHGTEHRVPERRALRLLAPRQPVYPVPASPLSSAPQPLVSLQNGTVRSQRPFSHPQLSPLARIPSRGRRSRPTASLTRLPVFLPVRLFGSATSRWFAPASGCIHASSPFHSLLACFAGCAARFRSPPGVFTPSGSKPPLASQPFGPPSGIARSSFAPRSFSI